MVSACPSGAARRPRARTPPKFSPTNLWQPTSTRPQPPANAGASQPALANARSLLLEDQKIMVRQEGKLLHVPEPRLLSFADYLRARNVLFGRVRLVRALGRIVNDRHARVRL